jgi:membrane protein
MPGCRLRDIGWMFRQTFLEWNQDRAQRMGAAVAFYALLSLAPLLIFLVALAATILGNEAAEGQLALEAQDLIGIEEARALQAMVLNADKPGIGFAATLLSAVTLFFSASSVAAEIQDALNTIWQVSGPRRTLLHSVFYLIGERFYALGMVLGAGFLLLLSVSLSASIAAIGKFFHFWLPYPEAVLESVESLVSFAVITFILAVFYKILPDLRLQWSDVIAGAVLTSLLFTLGKQPLAYYLGKVSFGSTYGAAGSLVVILVWVYYSAQLFFLGAEFTKVYTRRLGSLKHAANP